MFNGMYFNFSKGERKVGEERWGKMIYLRAIYRGTHYNISKFESRVVPTPHHTVPHHRFTLYG